MPETTELTAVPAEQKGDYIIQHAPCTITGRFEKVIRVNLGDLSFPIGDGEIVTGTVYGAFSAEALGMMQRALEVAPDPLQFTPPEQVTLSNKYQWLVAYDDGTQLHQYGADGNLAHHFGHIDLPRVEEFWVYPKHRAACAELPAFVLSKARGFYQKNLVTGVEEALGLPMPHAPFHWEYQRRVWQVNGAGAMMLTPEQLPHQVRHELGWRVDTLHGDPVETWCVIGIEDDNGTWQVVRMEPLESRHLQPKRIHGEVRIMEIASQDRAGDA